MIAETATNITLQDAKLDHREISKPVIRHYRREKRWGMIWTPVDVTVELPPEILCLIFLFTVEVTPITIGSVHDTMLPWVLLQVCWRWRQIALTECRLWNHVTVCVNPPLRCGRTAEIYDIILEQWTGRIFRALSTKILPRCRQLSFELTYEVLEGYGSHHVYPVDYSLRSLVVACLPRIQGLSLQLPIESAITFYTLPPDVLSGIESLSLRFDSTHNAVPYIEEQIYRNTAIFSKAQSLRKLSLRSNSYRFVLAEDIPWHQLLDIDIFLPRLNLLTILRVLQKCTITSKCFFGRTLGNNIAPKMANRVPVPHLTHIGLSRFDTILDHLILPSLTHLRIEEESLAPSQLNRVTCMIKHSECILRELCYTLPDDVSKGSWIFGQDPTPFNNLLAVVRSLGELRMTNLFLLPWLTLYLIACGDLLPELIALECCITSQSTSYFTDLVERRAYTPPSVSQPSKSKHSLREAVGHFFVPSGTEVSRMGAVSRALQRIGELRMEHDRHFELNQTIGPWLDLAPRFLKYSPCA